METRGKSMGHIVELITELLFGLAKNKPDKMPDDISYNSNFIVKYPAKKTIARIVATLIIVAVFALLLIIVDADTQILYVIFIILFGALLILSLIAFSFRCYVTEQHIKKSYWGLFSKYIEWDKVSCIRVVEKTDEKSVIIAIYNDDGKCVIDLNTDMENVWYIVKMAKIKNITVKHEKDLSLKQISHL